MALEVPILISETAGFDRVLEPVRIGLPLPRGKLASAADLQVFDPQGQGFPTQGRALAHWSDGSIRWLLVDFLATVPANRQETCRLRAAKTSSPLTIRKLQTVSAIGVHTGPAQFEISTNILQPLRQVVVEGKTLLGANDAKTVLLDQRGRRLIPRIETATIEDQGPVRGTLYLKGAFCEGKRPRLGFEARLSFFAYRSLCRLHLNLFNPRAARHAGGLWDLGDRSSFFFKDLSLELAGVDASQALVWSTRVGDIPQQHLGSTWRLYQDSSGGPHWDSPNHVDRHGRPTVRFKGYRVTANVNGSESVIAAGSRATPHVRVRTAHGWMAVAVDRFWQNFPKTLEVRAGCLRVALFPHECAADYELQGGESKRHSLLFEFGQSSESNNHMRSSRAPLDVALEPVWVEDSGAVAHFARPQRSRNRQYNQYIDNIIAGPHAFVCKREAIDEYGWRNFGDLYADHEAVGSRLQTPFVSHYNNQYDFIYGAGVHFLRSADTRWHQLMIDAARHCIDIDIYHTDGDRAAYNHGMFWHTDRYRPAQTATHRCFSRHHNSRVDDVQIGGGPCNEHNYTSGLTLYYFLSGDRWARDAVLELAQWVQDMDDGAKTFLAWADSGPTGLATQTLTGDYQKAGRGAANSINALLDAHQLTGRQRYLELAETFIRRCIHPRDDIEALGLRKPEQRWSYLVFLQVLGKYLDHKTETGAYDYTFFYARDSLLHYADWMLINEAPYKTRLHEVLLPTETWPAHDIRKSCIFHMAAQWGPPAARSHYRQKADAFYQTCLEDLLSFKTATLTRPLVLLCVFGPAQGFFDRYGHSQFAFVEHAHHFGDPIDFVPQKKRFLSTLRRHFHAGTRDLYHRLRSRLSWTSRNGR